MRHPTIGFAFELYNLLEVNTMSIPLCAKGPCGKFTFFFACAIGLLGDGFVSYPARAHNNWLNSHLA
jgi:hypothetical protein